MWAVSPSQDAPSYWGKAVFWCVGGIVKTLAKEVFKCRQDAQTTFPFFGGRTKDSRRVT